MLIFCHTTPRIAAYPRGEHCPQPYHPRPRPKHSAPAVAHATKGSLKPLQNLQLMEHRRLADILVNQPSSV
ncbi:hypothetical protein [Kingella oralis]|uniref:hypothetical protein n=1 Tax=Kingella oralis TaxID=505 RepID=UPI0034E5E5EA